MTGDAIFEVRNVTVSFGRTRALDAVSLSGSKGATGLLGPNGAGKSTLIKMLLGLLPPDTGDASVLGLSVRSDVKRIRQRVGYMPEHDGYIPGLSGVQFVAYMGELSGLTRSIAMARAHEILFYVGLGEARYRSIETYSTGMKQRVKLAQALVHDPALLFLDEPTNGLDPKGRQEMLALVKDIATTKDMSVILSSHLLPDVEHACRDVIMMQRGKVLRTGAIKDLTAAQSRLFEVRIKGDPDRFRQEAKARSLAVVESETQVDGGSFTLEIADGAPEPIFAAAAGSGAQVRHLLRKRPTLEEVFQGELGAKPA